MFMIGIEDSLKTEHTAALCGVHGLGKSSVVTEFAYLNEKKYEHIFFIHAVGADFDIFIGEIVSDLQIPTDEQTTPAEKLQMFQHWLAENDNWLLILDNVDDVSAINACRFTNHTGDVVFTSNDEAVYQIGNRVEVPNMNAEEAASLLFQHWKGLKIEKFDEIPAEKHEALLQIAEMFGNSPLAMTFVGVYLAEEDESLDEFLENYHDKEQNLLEKYEFLSNYQEKNVATPFLLAFEAVSKPKDDSEREILIAEAVKDYLKISAFIAPDAIPEEFLSECVKILHPEQEKILKDDNFFKEVRKRFKKSPIFKRDADTKTFSTHRIVQEVMRFKIKNEEDCLLKTISETLNEKIPYFEFNDNNKVELYISHSESFIAYLEYLNMKIDNSSNLENLNKIILIDKIGDYNQTFGQYVKAEKNFLLAHNIAIQVFGNNHHITAKSYNNLGNVYYLQNKFQKAEENYQKALNIKLNQFGEIHPDTASSYCNLGNVFDSQGDFQKGIDNHLKAVQIYLKVYDKKHPSLAKSYDNLGNAYGLNGDYSKAFYNHYEAFQIRLDIYGENHPDTAKSYNNLGHDNELQNKLQEAANFYDKALKIYQEFLPENHLEIQRTKINLESVRKKMEK